MVVAHGGLDEWANTIIAWNLVKCKGGRPWLSSYWLKPLAEGLWFWDSMEGEQRGGEGRSDCEE